MQIERWCNRDISLPLHQILCSRDGIPHIDLCTWKMEAARTDTAFSVDTVAFYVEWWCATRPSTVAPSKIRPVELS
jgi:hypothetical protein